MRQFVLFSPGGLCNRLKMLVSGQVLAEAAGAHLEFLWPLNSTCGCSYEDLFEPSVDVRTVPEPAIDSLPQRIGWGVAPPDLLTEPGDRVVLGHMSWLVRPDLYPAHEALWPNVSKRFDALVPRPWITQRADDFARQHFRTRMVGVHLRRGDFHLARPDVVANTEAAMTLVHHHLERWPDAGIFLATDDSALAGYMGTQTEGVREILRKRFGDRVVHTVPRSLDRTSPQAIEDALVDLFLLRRTHALVGTASSSFSQLAAFGRDVPLEMAEGGTRRVLRLEHLARRLGLYRPIMALAGWRLGRKPERFFDAWLAVRYSPMGDRLMRVIRLVVPTWRP